VDMADKAARISLGGQPVFAAVFNGQGHSHTYIGQGYSNRTARGTARGDEAETVYAVVSGRHYNSGCCLSVQRYPAPLGPPPPFPTRSASLRFTGGGARMQRLRKR
jgi:hypothetical protein